MKHPKLTLAIVSALALAITGCRSGYRLTKSACKQAINAYYATRPDCLLATPDPLHPDLGKLCIGNRIVTSIDSFTPPWDGMPRTSMVHYHYTLTNVPAWAHSQEILQAHPELRAALSAPHQASDHIVGGDDEHDRYVWIVFPPGTFAQ